MSFFQGPMRFLEFQEVTGAAVTSVTFSGLDGNVDREYFLRWKIINDAAFTTFEFRPNAATTELSTRRVTALATDTVSTDQVTVLRIQGIESGDQATGQLIFEAVTGDIRYFSSFGVETNQGSPLGSDPQLEWNAGFWSNTATNLTSIELNASNASAYGVGSKFALFAVDYQW